MKQEVLILEAQEFACANYNIPREEFVVKAANEYPTLAEIYQFKAAIVMFDTIQREMKEVA